jgi:UDP-N-acetylmuramoylalanine--D-glutamate ligase
MILDDLLNKKIAVLGLGKEGFSTAKYLTKHHLKYSVLDENENLVMPEEIASSLEATHLGSNYLADINNYDVIFRSPGIRLSLPALQTAIQNQKIISSQTKFFFDNCTAPIIGVTGTKGKGTTATLINDILKKTGKTVFFGGNIGAPVLDFLDEVSESSWVVLELSSFQLQDLQKSPKVAVVLAVGSDHMDYHLTEGAYWDAKANIVLHQTETDFAILNHDSPVSLSFSHKTKAKVIYFSRKSEVNPGVYLSGEEIMTHFQSELLPLVKKASVQLIGEHNLDNITAAASAAKVLGIDNQIIKQAIEEFRGLPHRLQLCGESKGVKFYDDSASTNPETTIAALKSFTQPEVLIMGGSSKGADFTKLGAEIALSTNIVGVILIGEEADRIEQAIKSNGTFTGFILTHLKDTKEVVSRAVKLAPHGGVVILSPACASFDMFKNYSDRGDRFQEEVKLLNETAQT